MTTASPRRKQTAGDPLPMGLDAPDPLAALRPERAVPCSEPFDAPDWSFSVDWEGMRAVLRCAGGRPTLTDERGERVDNLFPEVLAAVTGAPRLLRSGAVLDGVICKVSCDGRPDLPGLAALVAERRGGNFSTGEAQLAYLVTDLLGAGERSHMATPLHRRHALATKVLQDAPPLLLLSDEVAGEGRAFCNAAAHAGLSQVLARDRTSHYRPGVASPQRLRISLDPRVDAVVVGLSEAGPQVDIVLAEYVNGALAFAGQMAVRPPPASLAWLRLEAARWATPVAVVAGLPVPPNVRWLHPHVVASVRARRDDRGIVQNATLIALRDDRDPASCVRRAPVAPPATSAVATAFRPLVIRSLPLAGG